MASFTVAPATDEEVRSGELGRRLRAFNYRTVGEYPETLGVRLNARDAEGAVVGGLRAYVFLQWLNVELLWVDEAVRGRGLGRRLLCEAERLAVEAGARHAKLETFAWQARPFYLKQGYEEFGRIDDYVQGFWLAYMRKALVPLS